MNAPTDPPRSPRSMRAVLALLVVTVIWGWTFAWMKQGVNASNQELGARGTAAGIALFMTLRFAIAALVVALASKGARRGLTRGSWTGGFVIGGLLWLGFLLQMFGLTGVSPPVSAFLTSLYVLFTALLISARTRKRMSLALGVGALLATFGGAFIGGPPQLTFGISEWLTVGCAFVFALHILATDRYTKSNAPMPITLTSFLVVALASALTLAATQLAEDAPSAGALARLATTRGFLWPMLASSVCASSIALTLMNLYQRELDPVRAAILYAIEPVWASLVALTLGLAQADPWLWIGGGALLTGNLIAELGPLVASRRNAARASAAPGG